MRLAVLGVALALVALPAAAQAAPLAGPDGTSLDKVLVIGTDGTRWDLLDAAMKAGRAPNLARLRREGFGRPTLLEYGPNTITLSEAAIIIERRVTPTRVVSITASSFLLPATGA